MQEGCPNSQTTVQKGAAIRWGRALQSKEAVSLREGQIAKGKERP